MSCCRSREPDDAIGSISCFFVAAIVLTLCWLPPSVQAQEVLTLRRTYDLGASRYSEGLDFYNQFLWHTTKGELYRLNLDGATDGDGDGVYDLQAERTWVFTHNRHSESSVWSNGELYNFTFWDLWSNASDDIYKLVLNDDETYLWEQVGVGLGVTNWGSCRDSRYPGESIIYTGHYDNVLMWYDPASGSTFRTQEVPGLNWIEDLGMDRYGTVWASSFNAAYPGLYRIDPDSGAIVGTYVGPGGLGIIDGIAIRSAGEDDVLYVTGKNTRFIWEYLVPAPATVAVGDDLAAAPVELHANYPNPFNPSTTVVFSLPEAERIRVCVYGLDGTRVRTLVSDVRDAGVHSVVWDGNDDTGRAVASGSYVCRLEAGGYATSRTMALVR